MHGPVLHPFAYDEAHPYAAGQHRGVDIGADTAGETVVAPADGHGQLRRECGLQRQVGDDRDRGRLLRHAHASRLDRRRQRRDGRRARRDWHGRPERHARGGRAVRPPRDPAHGRSERLRRPGRPPPARRRQRHDRLDRVAAELIARRAGKQAGALRTETSARGDSPRFDGRTPPVDVSTREHGRAQAPRTNTEPRQAANRPTVRDARAPVESATPQPRARRPFDEPAAPEPAASSPVVQPQQGRTNPLLGLVCNWIAALAAVGAALAAGRRRRGSKASPTAAAEVRHLPRPVAEDRLMSRAA